MGRSAETEIAKIGWVLTEVFLSVAALRTVKTHASIVANISPGESFHLKEARKDWLIDWYVVREKGRTLFGTSPKTFIEPISKEEFMHAVQANMKAWGEWIYDMHERKDQAFAILTMCRALYAYKNGEQASKKQAALWAQKELPEWATLIQNALLWREAWRYENVDHDATFPETLRFVRFAISQYENETIRKAQELLRPYLPEGRSLSDELIAERRLED